MGSPAFFITLSLLFSPLLSLQTPFIAPINKDHISRLYSLAVHLQTPLRRANLHLDLGGAFSWIDCYNHYNSSSYKLVKCNSPLSDSLDAKVCSSCIVAPAPVCGDDDIFSNLYPEKPSLRDGYVDYLHPDLTDSENLITDVLALSSAPIPDVPFACVKTLIKSGLERYALNCLISHPLNLVTARNVIGLAALGRANESIPSVISARFNRPRVFAICLSGTRMRSGVAIFGSRGPYEFSPDLDLSKTLIYTPLLLNPYSGSIYTYWLPSYEYYIGLSAIRINNEPIRFNTSLLAFDSDHGRGGAKISTSTPYALLQSSIYRAFATTFIKAAKNLTLANAVEPFGVCFTATTETVAATPVVELVMGKGKVVWRLGGRNSMVRIKRKGVDLWCLGFINGGEFPRTPIVIGGLQMEDRLLQFDLENYRFGFSSSTTTCSNFNYTSVENFL